MVKPAGNVTPHTASGQAYYELPLSERMRTFLRLEFLYRQMLYNSDGDSRWATRATISTLLEILAILLRGDVRGEVHKELDHHINTLQRYQSQPGVDSKRLETLIRNLVESRGEVSAIGTQYLQPLKDSEFLRAIKHRNSIPGGTCEFDLPEYNHWLRQPYARREQDLERWIGAIRPLCDAVVEVLWLIRESARADGQDSRSTACTSTACERTRRAACCASCLGNSSRALSRDQRQPAPFHGAFPRVVDDREPRRADRPRRLVSARDLLKRFDHRHVGRQNVMLAQGRRRHPAQCLAFQAGRLVLPVVDEKEVDGYRPVGVVVFEMHEVLQRDRVDAEFFREFPC